MHHWTIKVALNVEHNQMLQKNIKGALKMVIVAVINSSSKLKNHPNALVGEASIKLDCTFSQVEQQFLTYPYTRLKVGNFTCSLENGGDGVVMVMLLIVC